MTLLSLATRLTPSASEKAEVQTSSSHLVDILNGKVSDGLIPASLGYHFIGSYARGTKPSPVDDVDILYIVGEAASRDENWHTITKSSFVYASDDHDADGNLSSLLLLNRIKKAIVDAYPNSELRRNHEVVNILLSSYERSFDLVPAWHVPASGYYLIPEGQQKHKWKKTNPFRDKAILDSANGRTAGTATSAIVIMKHWFRRKQVVTPRSYHLEAIAYAVFAAMTTPSSTLSQSLAILLNNFSYNNLLSSCPDPTGLSEPLSSDLTADDIQKITAEGKEAAQLLSTQGEAAFLEAIDEE